MNQRLDKLQANIHSFLVEAAASPIEKLEQRKSGNSWVAAQIWLSTWHWALHLALSFVFVVFTSYELLFAYFIRTSDTNDDNDDLDSAGWVLNTIEWIPHVLMIFNGLTGIVGMIVAFYAYVLCQ